MPRNYDNYKEFHTYFLLNDWQTILKRAEVCKLKPTTYIKRIAKHGVIKIYDTKELSRLNVELNKIGVNINQVARLCNETHSVALRDIELIQQYMYGLKTEVKLYLDKIREKNL
jgi:hypothetical protein